MTGEGRVTRAVRPATAADAALITELCRSIDTHWFGAPEHDESEVREELDQLKDLARDTRLTFDGDDLVCAVLRGRHDAVVLVRPGTRSDSVLDDALGWLSDRLPARVEVLDRDIAQIAALQARGWYHAHSAFELSRPVSDEWPAAGPNWPGGIGLRDARTDDLEDVHRLVYVEAGWTDVTGHVARELDEWRGLFVGDRAPGECIVLAERDGRPVGVAIIRVFSDGTGWISQLAVATDERGRGLGRALVSESFHRLVATGASSLGLGVSAANRGALRLYLELGLIVEREWMLWDPATTG